MKGELDVMSAVAGAAGAFIKGKKQKRPFKTLVLDVVLGLILGYLTIGLLDYFIVDQTPKVIMLVSFCVGWVANELTDILEKTVYVAYEIAVNFFKNMFSKKKEKIEK
jgi:uncharacterized membrane protein